MKSKKLQQLLAKRKKKPVEQEQQPRNTFMSRSFEGSRPEYATPVPAGYLINAGMVPIEPHDSHRLWLISSRRLNLTPP
jgi:hypothetical protein